jgi:hypothetical protein
MMGRMLGVMSRTFLSAAIAALLLLKALELAGLSGKTIFFGGLAGATFVFAVWALAHLAPRARQD